MDAYLKKEQIGTLFVRVGAPEGGFRGGGGQGGLAQKSYMPIQLYFLEPHWFTLQFSYALQVNHPKERTHTHTHTHTHAHTHAHTRTHTRTHTFHPCTSVYPNLQLTHTPQVNHPRTSPTHISTSSSV